MGDLGIYIHVPFCKHACPYCDFYKLELRSRPARARLRFPEAARRELEAILGAEPTLRDRPLATIYFGGGTPSTLVPAAVAELLAFIRGCFPPGAPPEITLEANPENLTPARARQWHDAGINRLSIGVQTFDARELALLERLHQPETIGRAVRHAREAGFRNLSLDLMFALPGQGVAAWLDNLRQALTLEPEHLSFYGLTIHEGTPFHEAQARGDLRLPDEDTQAAMYLEGCALLRDAGYEHYEISNFGRPGFRSAHNQRYWTRGDVLGLGPGAHSNIASRRWSNREDIDHWLEHAAHPELVREPVEEPSAEVLAAEVLFTALRRVEGLNARDHPGWFRALEAWRASLPEEERARLTRKSGNGLALTAEGWLVSDAIIEALIRGNVP